VFEVKAQHAGSRVGWSGAYRSDVWKRPNDSSPLDVNRKDGPKIGMKCRGLCGQPNPLYRDEGENGDICVSSGRVLPIYEDESQSGKVCLNLTSATAFTALESGLDRQGSESVLSPL
jgi:hypothetical protein